MNTKMMVVLGIFLMAFEAGGYETVQANGAAPPFSNQAVMYRLDEMKTELKGLRQEIHTMKQQMENVKNEFPESPNLTQRESGEAVTQLKQDLSSMQSTLKNRFWLEVGGFLIVLSIVGYLGFKIKT